MRNVPSPPIVTLDAVQPETVIDHPSGYLATSDRNQRFCVKEIPGFIAYRECGRHWISLGGVHAEPAAQAELLDEFVAAARGHRRRVVAVQVREEQTELFRDRGFTVNPFGSSYSLRVPGFSYRGSKRMRLRQKIKQARKAGLRVLEVGCELPASEATFSGLRGISDAWLAAKRKKELEFMIGELGNPSNVERRIFVTVDASGKWIGFITYVPAWGTRPGYLHDLTRRLPDAAVGAMELCNARALDVFADEGVEWLHFGFTPFVVGDDAGDASSPLMAWLVRMLYRHGSVIYPARNQAAYKRKWNPDVVEAEYAAFQRLSVRAIVDLLRLTRSI